MQAQDIAEVIKTHRRAAKLSRVQLAEMAGVGYSRVFEFKKRLDKSLKT